MSKHLQLQNPFSILIVMYIFWTLRIYLQNVSVLLLYPPQRSWGGYTGFTLFVRPSVRVYESTCIGYYLCTLNTNWIHFVYWIYPTIQCVEHVYIGYLRVITQNTHLVTDAAHVSVKWPSILCPLYWLHTARFFLWWPVGQSEMVAS